MTVTRSTVRDNRASFGGGISNGAGGTTKLKRTTVRDNTASARGGGIFNDFVGNTTITLSDSAVHHNSAAQGGGVFNTGTASLSNTRVYANTAGSGAGITADVDSVMTLIRSFVERNTATLSPGPGGGGILAISGGSVALERSRVRHNQPDNCAPPGAVQGCTG
ncbi:hypothetical protein [Streptomyces sp. NBC_01264]|uniref:hypothetical protein n=1 Tax=Streptomyces sp. NBC_01264 TaxID=2903804 RepID=UPI0022524A24|nr:hypothetical protein [Streptomyces sp. NBC_01264]MCX4784345.1 hypothetical protein [Streptomyces sp. NBC_01264]